MAFFNGFVKAFNEDVVIPPALKFNTSMGMVKQYITAWPLMWAECG